MRKLLISATCVIILGSVACSSRPDESEARDIFRQRYPQRQLLDVTIDEDEVAVRTFLVKYKDPSNGKTYEQFWLYFDDGDEPRWAIKEPRPVAQPIG